MEEKRHTLKKALSGLTFLASERPS